MAMSRHHLTKKMFAEYIFQIESSIDSTRSIMTSKLRQGFHEKIKFNIANASNSLIKIVENIGALSNKQLDKAWDISISLSVLHIDYFGKFYAAKKEREIFYQTAIIPVKALKTILGQYEAFYPQNLTKTSYEATADAMLDAIALLPSLHGSPSGQALCRQYASFAMYNYSQALQVMPKESSINDITALKLSRLFAQLKLIDNMEHGHAETLEAICTLHKHAEDLYDDLPLSDTKAQVECLEYAIRAHQLWASHSEGAKCPFGELKELQEILKQKIARLDPSDFTTKVLLDEAPNYLTFQYESHKALDEKQSDIAQSKGLVETGSARGDDDMDIDMKDTLSESSSSMASFI